MKQKKTQRGQHDTSRALESDLTNGSGSIQVDSVRNLADYLNRCGDDVQVHISIEGGEAHAPDEGHSGPVLPE